MVTLKMLFASDYRIETRKNKKSVDQGDENVSLFFKTYFLLLHHFCATNTLFKQQERKLNTRSRNNLAEGKFHLWGNAWPRIGTVEVLVERMNE